MHKQYLSRQEAADFLSGHGLAVTKNSLQKMATTGGGPEYSIFANRAVYRPEILLAWALARIDATRRSTTSEMMESATSKSAAA